MSKEISIDALAKDNIKNCPVTGLPLLALQEYANIHMCGDYYISLYKIGESIVYTSGRGNLENYEIGQFNNVLDDFCKTTHIVKPYIQIRDVSNVEGRIPLSIMQKQTQYFFKEQETYLGVITINDPSWMKLFIRWGVHFFSPKTRFISAKNYVDALQKAQQLLAGDPTTHQERKPGPAYSGFRFEDVQFDPQWSYQNHQTGFSYKMGVIPGRLQFSTICGAMENMDDVLQTVALINKISNAYPFIGKSFIVVDLTQMSGRSSINIQKAFAGELKRLWNIPGEFQTIHVIISPGSFYRIAGKLFFSLMGQRVIAVATIEEAFKKINGSFYSWPKKKKTDNTITITTSNLDEIAHVCSYFLWDEKGEDISIEVAPDNPLFEIAEMLELVKTDLNEQRKTEHLKNQERLKESENNRRQLLSMMEDTEAAKEALLKTKAEMAAIIENTLDSIWSININYEIIYINEVFIKAYEAIFGSSLKPGSQILDSLPQALRTLWKERYDRVLNGERWVVVDEIDAHGTPVYIEVAANPIYNNDIVVGASLFGRDITDRIKAEETRQQLEVVKNTMHIKQNFLANMSHEIRTPLTGVLGMLEILEQTRLDEHQKDYLQTLKTSGKHLKQIIDQVLDYSKIEAGKIQIIPTVFALESMIKQSLMLYENILNPGVQTKYFIDPQIPVFIEADEFRLSQIVNNLVSNAVKFTYKGLISINCMLIAMDNLQKKCTIRIEITDTGPGIPDHLHENLFTPFSQIEVSDIRKYEGTGLGLSICRELIKLMGGELGMKSEMGKGSTFWFTFPASMAEQQPTPLAEDTGIPPKKNLSILLAEDKVINQKVIKLMLSSLGHELQIACNGQVALDLFEPDKFDLILMDIQMPVMDGVAATQKLKEAYDDLPPIVGLSANAFEGDREKYMALGMDEYLTKPMKKEDFEGLIKKLFLHHK